MRFVFVGVCALFTLSQAGQSVPGIFREKLCSIQGSSLSTEFPSSLDYLLNVPNNISTPRDIESTSPWTRKPECITDGKTRKRYCVYTNKSYVNNRGITLFTSPSLAKTIQKLPAFIKDLHNSTNSNSPPFEIKYVPGRGNGIFATRKLNRGDPLISYAPIAVYSSDALYSDYQLGYQLLQKTFDYLPEATRKIYERLAMHSEGHPVMERINTNAFAGEVDGEPHFFMYPEAALLNHDCRPNAMYYHDPKTFVHSTVASRTIHPGEEITNAYINILQPRDERQNILRQMWNFTCTCSACSNPHFHESDIRLDRIQDLQKHLTDWSEDSLATPEMAEELISLYEQEQVHSAKGPGHMFAAFAYNAVGYTSMAKKHARLAIEAGLVTIGLLAADEEEMMEIRRNPKEHWTFLARERRSAGK